VVGPLDTYGAAAAIQSCHIHKGRNIIERLPEHLHASVKKELRQSWEQDDAETAERLLRNLARRLEQVDCQRRRQTVPAWRRKSVPPGIDRGVSG